MAKIIRTSGAWKSTCLKLNRANFKPEKPAEIFGLLEVAKKEYALAKSNATQDIQNKIESLKKDLSQLEVSFESDIHKCQTEIYDEIELVQLALQILQDGAGLIRKIIIYSRVKKHKDKILQLKNKYKNCQQIFQKRYALRRRLWKRLKKTTIFLSRIVAERRNIMSLCSKPFFRRLTSQGQ